jgi:hypothetical protein
VKPFFCYYGGKWRMARHYPAPMYPVIVEPFAGAAGYSTAWGAGRTCLLADRDPVLARLWRWLIAATPEDVRALPLIAAGQDVRTLPVAAGAQDLIAFWLNKGVSRPRRTASAWMRAGTHSTSFWGPTVRERVASQVPHIKAWEAAHASFTDLPDIEATWFIDPPYAGRPGSHYTYGSAQIDYARLAAWCRSRRGQVIVCEAQGADWLPFAALGTFKANATSVGRRTAEGVWEREQ